MESSVTIREGTMEDVECIVGYNAAMAMETESLRLDFDVLRAGTEAVIRDPSLGCYFLVEVEGEVVGQLMITQEWMPRRNALAWWIQSVYVKPEHRRKGYYKKLYQHARQTAQERGVAALKLYAHKENARAKETYTKLGMKEVGPVYAIRDVLLQQDE